MAFSGVQITFGYAGNSLGNGGFPLLAPAYSSETMAAAGTSSVSAGGPGNFGAPIVSLYSSADIFFATGPTPDASVSTATTTSPRRFLPMLTPVDVYVNTGDKVAWVLA